jgi:hypothetical protein
MVVMVVQLLQPVPIPAAAGLVLGPAVPPAVLGEMLDFQQRLEIQLGP